jgi:TolB-like protein/DNA-binding winged helix-turn-helix (wHTH) protein/tetratricopeptide (TPR) repeat protein
VEPVETPNPSPSVVPRIVRFGAYEADLHTGELRKSGMRLKVGAQPFQVLTILLEKRGDVATRDELRERIWPSGTFVDFENGLNKSVARLRGLLNDDPANPRFIETVPRRGYRFLAPVESVEAMDKTSLPAPAQTNSGNGSNSGAVEAQTPSERQDENDSGNERSKQSSPAEASPSAQSAVHAGALQRKYSSTLARVVVCAALGLVVLLATSAILYSRYRSHNAGARIPIRSIAVLPFQDVTGNSDQEYFAEGMTDELIKDLGKMGTLRVVSGRSVSRFKHSEEPLDQIGRELGVDAIVEGTSAHTGDRVRLTIRLVGVSGNEDLWAGRYVGSMNQLLAAQVDIARNVARNVHLDLPAEAKAAGTKAKHVPSPEAYDAYLEGRYYYYHWGNRWTTVWWKKSCKYFERAIQLDPQYAAAYAALADSYAAMNTTGMEVPAEERIDSAQALAMAKKAIELDDTDAEGHAALGNIFLNNWQWPEAREQFKTAVSLRPSDPQIRLRLASYYRAVGKLKEAIEETREARRLDPSADIVAREAFLYFTDGQYEQAEKEFKNAIALEPGIISAKKGLYLLYERLHRLPEAITELHDLLVSTRHPDRAREITEIYRKNGYEQAVQYVMREEIMDDYKERSKPFSLASDYARLGDKEKALEYLQKAYETHSNQLSGLKTAYEFASASTDLRFQTILKNLKLDDASLAQQNKQ